MKFIYKFSIVASFLGLWITSLLPESFELFFGFILIFTFGMIHGSNDIMIVNAMNENGNEKIEKNNILLIYLVIVSSAVFIFYILPTAALLLFILFSAYHFGEQHWNDSLSFWSKPTKRLFFFCYGLLILFLIFHSNIEEVKSIVHDITSIKINEIYSGNIILILSCILTVLVLIHTLINKINTNSIFRELFSLFVLVIIFKSSSLIWGFCIYFIIWHSIPSLVDQITFIYGDYKKQSFFKYVVQAFPYWVVSLIGIIVLYFLFKEDKQFYSLFFAFIAAVTFPHAIVMIKMFSKQKVK